MRATVPAPAPSIRDAVLRQRLIETGLLVPLVERPTLSQDMAGRIAAANEIYADGLGPSVMLNRDADPEVRAHLDHLQYFRPPVESLVLPWSAEIFGEPEEESEPEPVAA